MFAYTVTYEDQAMIWRSTIHIDAINIEFPQSFPYNACAKNAS